MSETSDPHLRDNVLAAYLDRALPAAARATADAHLSECASCRDELVTLSGLAHSTKRPARLTRVAGPAAAVAAALLLAVLGPWRAPANTAGERLRETTGVSAGARLRAVAPLDSATLRADSVRFTWRREAPDAAYHLTITDDSGSVQWAFDTSDTTVGLPATVHLSAGRVYYWYVDAIGGDGKTRATALRRFQVKP